MNRREFLKKSARGAGGALLTATPLSLFIHNAINSLFNRAYAIEASPSTFGDDPDKKLISIDMYGGIDQHYFNLPLRPNGVSDQFQYNKINQASTSMLLTKALQSGNSENGYSGFEGTYEMVKVGNFYLPYFWSGKIPTVDGSSVNATELAQNMMTMRGMQTFDNHYLSSIMQIKPGPGPSITGLMADAATTPIPSVSTLSDSNYYESRNRVSQMSVFPQYPGLMSGSTTQLNHVSNNTSLVNALSAFLAPSSQGLFGSNPNFADAADLALDVIKKHAGDRHKYLPVTDADRKRARALMKTQFGNLQQVYTDLRMKYIDLVSRSMGDPTLRLAGADDLEIPGSQIDGFKIAGDSIGNSHYVGSNLANNILDYNSRIELLPESMAIAEFMLMGGSTNLSLSSSISVHCYNFQTRIDQIKTGTNAAQSISTPTMLYSDAHHSGAYVQMLLYTRYARSVAACIYELIQKMKSRSIGNQKTLFDRSVVLLHSEFTRSAANNLSGSDHGYQGCALTAFSGMVESPLILGNIKVEGVNKYDSTWGAGAPVQAFGGQVATIGNGLNTIAHMLDLPQISSNAACFAVKGSNGKMVSTTGLPKNIKSG